MDLFTLRSRNKLPWGALRLLVAAGAAFLASMVYLFYGNPEIRLYKNAIQIKRHWAQKLTQEYGNKTAVYGGSSCAFSIDGERLLNTHQIPAVNMGLHAGLKPTMLTNWALSEMRPGDTLIVALEPGLLTEPLDSSPLAVQLSYAVHSPAWIKGPWLDQPVSGASSIFALRPSGYHIFVMLGKVAKGMPLYRYSTSDIHPSGWMTTAERRIHAAENLSTEQKEEAPDDGGAEPRLSHEGVKLLQYLRDWAQAHHVRLAYSLPWMYISPREVICTQRKNIAFLKEVSHYLPVLKDPVLGTCSNSEYFADTVYHLTAEAAALRTDSLAQQLKTWDVWKSGELEALPTMLSMKTAINPARPIAPSHIVLDRKERSK